MSLGTLAHALQAEAVRYALIGVGGASLYAHSAGLVFATQDSDLLLPPEPENALRAWRACEAAGLELWCGDEPLERPRDVWLAERIVERRAMVRAEHARFRADLTLVMAGFEFEAVWADRRTFRVEGVEVPVARLRHIVESKAAAGPPKDRLFLATHEDALRQLLGDEGE